MSVVFLIVGGRVGLFDVALDLLKLHSGTVWDPGRFRGIAPRRGREEVNPAGAPALILTPWQCLGLPS